MLSASKGGYCPDLAACQRGFSVAFISAAALASQLMEARDERRLLRLQQTLAGVQLLIVDGEEDEKSTRGVDFPTNGYVPLSQTGAELLCDCFSQRYERGAVLGLTRLHRGHGPSDHHVQSAV